MSYDAFTGRLDDLARHAGQVLRLVRTDKTGPRR